MMELVVANDDGLLRPYEAVGGCCEQERERK